MSGRHNSYQARQANRRRRARGWEERLREGRQRGERRAETRLTAIEAPGPYPDTPAGDAALVARLEPCPGCGAETTYTMCAECAQGGSFA